MSDIDHSHRSGQCIARKTEHNVRIAKQTSRRAIDDAFGRQFQRVFLDKVHLDWLVYCLRGPFKHVVQ
jgi:hypothetical protein